MPTDPFAIPDLTDPIWARTSAQQEPEKPIDYQAQADAYIKTWQTEQTPKPKAMPEIWRATQVKVDPYRDFQPEPNYRIPEEGEVTDEVSYIDKRANAKYSFSGKYDAALIKDIVEVGKDEGVDPYWLLATGLQETKLGKLADPHKKNYGPGSGKVFNLESNPLTKSQETELQSIANSEQGKLGQEASARRHQIRKVIQMFRNKENIAKHLYMAKFGRPPTLAETYQAWQGYGKIPFKKSFGGQENLYGWKDVPHGKRIIEHMESLKENSNIRDLVERN